MNNQITAPPNDYKFGLSFNYALWTQGTVVDLVNVPWNNDYRDIVRFQNRAKLDEYIDALRPTGVSIDKMSYVKPNTPVRINKPINTVIGYNYLRASNPLQPVPGNDVVKNYYYFITDVRYLSANTTELILQLDVWQTFGYDVQFGNCYVERGHIGIANENAFDSYGRDYLTVPEGFDLGGEYRVIAKRNEHYLTNPAHASAAIQREPAVMIVSTVDLDADPGTVENPNLVAARGTILESGASGAETYVLRDPVTFMVFMGLLSHTPWVSQGIISAGLIPQPSRFDPSFEYTAPAGKATSLSNYQPRPRQTQIFSNWRNSAEIINKIPARYRHLRKFFTFPYMAIELTSFTGNAATLKPEAWNNPNALVQERLTVTPPGRRLGISPRGYNADDGTIPDSYDGRPVVAPWQAGVGDDGGDYIDMEISVSNFPTMPITNSGQLSYLAANQSTLNYQRASAGWGEQRALRAAQTGYDQTTGALDTAHALNNIAVNTDIAQTENTANRQAQQSIVGAAGSLVSGGAGGGMAAGGVGAAAGMVGGGIGAATNLINTGIGIVHSAEALALRNSAAFQSVAANMAQGGYIRDTNKNLADWAARGDYANEIAGINARVQDAAMIQPTVSGQFGGETLNFNTGNAFYSLRWKLVDDATLRRVGEYWLRYGYAVNLPVYNLPSDMMVMTKFTYWKLTETYLMSSPMPEAFKQAIRGIFEKGVTVWRNPADIGNVDFADNAPLEGITL